MSLNAREQAIIEDIFRRLDAKAALQVSNGSFDPSTTLALFGVLRDIVRPLDPRFADRLIARTSENAAATISANAICQQIEQEARGGLDTPNPQSLPI